MIVTEGLGMSRVLGQKTEGSSAVVTDGTGGDQSAGAEDRVQ